MLLIAFVNTSEDLIEGMEEMDSDNIDVYGENNPNVLSGERQSFDESIDEEEFDVEIENEQEENVESMIEAANDFNEKGSLFEEEQDYGDDDFDEEM